MGARPPLTQEATVEAALLVLERDGIDGLSMYAVRVPLARADAQQVAELLHEAWRRKAPNRLIEES